MSRLMEDMERFATPVNEVFGEELGRSGLRETRKGGWPGLSIVVRAWGTCVV